MPVKNITDMRQFVSFLINDSLYGFDIRIVKEITPPVNICPIPLRNKDIKGVVNIRGQVVLVFDISVILNGSEQEKNLDCQIVILKVSREIAALLDYRPTFDIETIGNKPIGFVVGAIGDIVTVESGRIEAAPSHLDAQHSQYIEGIVHLAERPLLILNAGKIIKKSS
jgi:purine-binding chemotaxis protein CheW